MSAFNMTPIDQLYQNLHSLETLPDICSAVNTFLPPS
uniref:Uncharacterized protein n=2 Tax=Anguilla anguilla TaxID=7936 RepID=A0A0E9VV89_ANGAN